MPCLSASAGRSAEGLTATASYPGASRHPSLKGGVNGTGVLRLRRGFDSPIFTSPLPLSLASLWRGRTKANGSRPERENNSVLPERFPNGPRQRRPEERQGALLEGLAGHLHRIEI